jgi:hypothetical protein
MTFEKYDQATFFERYNKMPGKRGGLVRDNEEGLQLRNKLVAVKNEASRHCPVVTHVEMAPDKQVVE